MRLQKETLRGKNRRIILANKRQENQQKYTPHNSRNSMKKGLDLWNTLSNVLLFYAHVCHMPVPQRLFQNKCLFVHKAKYVKIGK
ncbi:hypothetical protein XELAEV_18016026mg [Xenopus laevis]|uniref:Uncharacterized protein n=1 Tax=Xenopus laevis TaxID=8355 RepID=A0A974BPZ2_XENLA|nr:hypothetical protein XELAEV_18002779mg [Xenopus laevis]OCT92959.1 hypothetical protein XELAEV_18016026mg [Xenopus laevis]